MDAILFSLSMRNDKNWIILPHYSLFILPEQIEKRRTEVNEELAEHVTRFEASVESLSTQDSYENFNGRSMHDQQNRARNRNQNNGNDSNKSNNDDDDDDDDDNSDASDSQDDMALSSQGMCPPMGHSICIISTIFSLSFQWSSKPRKKMIQCQYEAISIPALTTTLEIAPATKKIVSCRQPLQRRVPTTLSPTRKRMETRSRCKHTMYDWII